MKMFPLIKFLAYVTTVFIFFRVWYKGGIQSVIALGLIYMIGLFIASLIKEKGV